jgi:hypothetical protein
MLVVGFLGKNLAAQCYRSSCMGLPCQTASHMQQQQQCRALRNTKCASLMTGINSNLCSSGRHVH